MAIALALIPELFRGQKRHLANSLMLLAGRLGVGLVVAMCGWLLVAVDTWRGLLPDALQPLSNWRLTLLAAALPGLVLVPLILTMPLLRARRAAGPDEVPDALASSRRDASVAPAGTAVLPFLARHKLAFASFYFGVASMVLGIGAVMNFAPVVAMRQMSATPLQVANTMGAAMLVATVTGFLIAQVGYRQLLPRLGPRLPAMSLLAAAALGLLMAAGVLLARSPTQLFVCVGLFMTTVMAGTLLFPLALQEMAPAPLRGRLAAIAVTLNIVLGSLGPAVVGAVSDRLKEQPNGLLLAMVGVTCLAMLLSMLLLLPLQHRYVQTVSAARHAECVTDPRGAAA
ncbi:MFS transporter [Rubrivivax albus]|uniref:MFS transporter n=1 Tax=Rubrivivax albus TaxID=2499835 RepID=A0A437K278_9BURK|nr:MFS transporter [Rubrivivax albus]RVT54385.1 MFS transporter [Rubrivivax albus]